MATTMEKLSRNKRQRGFIFSADLPEFNSQFLCSHRVQSREFDLAFGNAIAYILVYEIQTDKIH